MRYFVNFTNHPSSKWGEKQLSAAKQLGAEIIDLPFPAVPPEMVDLSALAEKSIDNILFYYDEEGESTMVRRHIALHIMGETALVNEIVMSLFQSRLDIDIYVSTTERKTVEKGSEKTSIFEFVQFRQIQNPFPAFAERVKNTLLHGGATAELWEK